MKQYTEKYNRSDKRQHRNTQVIKLIFPRQSSMHKIALQVFYASPISANE
jgi:hypothetical protein